MGRLADKVIVVTGAAGRIGSASAQRFAQEGARLVLSDTPSAEEQLRAVTHGIDPSGASVIATTANITQQAEIDAVFDAAVSAFGVVNGVFANAGVMARGGMDKRLNVDDVWQTTLDTNITGTWRTIRAAAPHLRAAGSGSIVVTSSVAGIRGGINNAAYSSTKHAVIGIVKTAAHELGSAGIRVNAVAPTGVYSPMFLRPERLLQARPDRENPTVDDAAELWENTNLLHVPWIEAIDVANAVLFLLSEEARYLTAVTLPVDAGQSQLNPFVAVEGWLSRE